MSIESLRPERLGRLLLHFASRPRGVLFLCVSLCVEHLIRLQAQIVPERPPDDLRLRASLPQGASFKRLLLIWIEVGGLSDQAALGDVLLALPLVSLRPLPLCHGAVA